MSNDTHAAYGPVNRDSQVMTQADPRTERTVLWAMAAMILLLSILVTLAGC